MPTLARGQASDPTNPVLDLFTKVGGLPTDVALLEFEIWEKTAAAPAQVHPVGGGRESVDLDAHRLDQGHYVAVWTPGAAEPIGKHEVRWFFRVTGGGPEHAFVEEFDVAAQVIGFDTTYCTVEELRDEGVPTDDFGDAELLRKIRRASQMVDLWTGRFFEPRPRSFTIDGPQSRTLFVRDPIISVSSLTVGGIALDPSDYVVFNRHIRQGLLQPDDREDPRIELLQPVDSDLLFAIGGKVFQRGQQNIQITGVFGYTDPDGSPTGRTPDMICHATKLIVMRELYRMFDQRDDREDAASAGRIKRLRTRDQEIEYEARGSSGASGKSRLAPFTGDPEIDSILLRYRRPMHIGSSSGGPVVGAM